MWRPLDPKRREHTLGSHVDVLHVADDRIDSIVRLIMVSVDGSIPTSSPVAMGVRDAELTVVIRAILRWHLEALRGDDPLRAGPDFIRSHISQWSWYGVPADRVFEICKLTSESLWQTLAQTVEPARLSSLSPRFLEATHMMYAAVADGYLRPRTGHFRVKDARQRLARTLLDGVPADSVADDLGLRLADVYAVVACAPVERDGEEPGQLDRRFWSVVADALLQEPRTLYLSTGGSELLLVPCDAGRVEGDAQRVARNLSESACAAEVHLLGGVAWSPRADVPHAASEASEVLRVVSLLERGPGLYNLGEVIVECALFRSPDLTRRLATMVEPLELSGPDLLATLRVFLDGDLDRRRAARALQIHANTLDYRLRRIRELTGITATTPRGAQVLGAAMAARQLRPRAASIVEPRVPGVNWSSSQNHSGLRL